eukprot:9164851-Prorocentrum_lima.AAC.1
MVDSPPLPLGPASSTEPHAATVALQQQLELCQLSLNATLQQTLAEAQTHLQQMVETSVAAVLSQLPAKLTAS